MQYLGKLDGGYYAKALELRAIATEWLSYVPQSFPHYTRHTVGHSDEIVTQVSKMLFKDDDPTQPSVRLSSIEAYILVVAALLHDTGMVCSDSERLAILESREWTEWILANDSAAERLQEVELLQQSAGSDVAKLFVASVELRFLLADFVRRRHHTRSGSFVQLHEFELASYAFGDPLLRRTVADVCESHGLRPRQLMDDRRFPFERDIRGTKASVRLLAILLRLGDLLDLSNDRACPLLLNAGSPLPADSVAHWAQYQRLTDRLVTPSIIRLAAVCHTADEHQVVADWFGWICEEVQAAPNVLAGSTRHPHWSPPQATQEGSLPTITISQAEGATYLPVRWKFEVASDELIERLISDLYTSPLAFVRELVQNAADATRRRLALDLQRRSESVPSIISEAAADLRAGLPIVVSVGCEDDARWFLEVDDQGVGMSADVIRDYLLQIGSSYYRSQSFRESFPFSAGSYYGLGFLSVFGESSLVTIETRPLDGAEALKLTLRGPKSYFIVEQGRRVTSGTAIRVYVDAQPDEGQIAEFLRETFDLLEFPVLLKSSGGSQSDPRGNRDPLMEGERELVDGLGLVRIRSLPIKDEWTTGYLYVFERETPYGLSWGWLDWSPSRYLVDHPFEPGWAMPPKLLAYHGVTASSGGRSFDDGEAFGFRLDYRGPQVLVPMGREAVRFGRSHRSPRWELTQDAWSDAVSAHLSDPRQDSSVERWRYVQYLMSALGDLACFSELEAVPVRWHGSRQLIIPAEMSNASICVAEIDSSRSPQRRYWPPSAEIQEGLIELSRAVDGPVISANELLAMSRYTRTRIFDRRPLTGIRRHGTMLVSWWGPPDVAVGVQRQVGTQFFVLEFDSPHVVGVRLHEHTHDLDDVLVLNNRSVVLDWLRAVDIAVEAGRISSEARSSYRETLRKALMYQSQQELDRLIAAAMQWMPSLVPNLPVEAFADGVENATVERSVVSEASGQSVGGY